MPKHPLLWSSVALLGLWACGAESAGDEFTEEEGRAALMEACETQQGIGWLKREYGDRRPSIGSRGRIMKQHQRRSSSMVT